MSSFFLVLLAIGSSRNPALLSVAAFNYGF